MTKAPRDIQLTLELLVNCWPKHRMAANNRCLMIILAGILMSLHIYFRPTSLFNTWFVSQITIPDSPLQVTSFCRNLRYAWTVWQQHTPKPRRWR